MLANDPFINNSGLGTTNLSSTLLLSLQSYIFQTFHFNLMFISKLTKALNCVAIFLPTQCIFQDLMNGVRLVGRHKGDRLFYLDQCDCSSLVALQPPISPFRHHCHLSHSSLQPLKLLVPSCRQVESL